MFNDECIFIHKSHSNLNQHKFKKESRPKGKF